MNLPDRHDRPFSAKSSIPRQRVLIVGVNKGPVDVEDHCCRHAVLPVGVVTALGSRAIRAIELPVSRSVPAVTRYAGTGSSPGGWTGSGLGCGSTGNGSSRRQRLVRLIGDHCRLRLLLRRGIVRHNPRLRTHRQFLRRRLTRTVGRSDRRRRPQRSFHSSTLPVHRGRNLHPPVGGPCSHGPA